MTIDELQLENLKYSDILENQNYAEIEVKMLDFYAVSVYLADNYTAKSRKRKLNLWSNIQKKYHEDSKKVKSLKGLTSYILSRKDFLLLFEDLKEGRYRFKVSKSIDLTHKSQQLEFEVSDMTKQSIYKKYLISENELLAKKNLIQFFMNENIDDLSKIQLNIINEILSKNIFVPLNNIKYTELVGKDILFLLEKHNQLPSLVGTELEKAHKCYSEDYTDNSIDIEKRFIKKI